MPFRRSLPALLLLPAIGLAEQPKPDAPASADPRLAVELFAAAPDIVQPIAADFDAKGRLLVVESHTHFRPAKYDGPKHDRIRVIEDTDGDGKADRFTTFFEGTTATMDLAVHPDGSVYVATRNEIIRLRDADGDGKADEKTRIVFLDTKGNYPHNGLSGLTFDSRGDLNFGMGENLGEPYKLVGADGTTLTGGGEGGNYYHCTADGKKLRRVATGFWNPFGACRDIYGRLFVVDNDPDASPPCRMLHVVEGGDYGFQFRYGRSGRHPFQAWNGELPGTLPYVTGTGESPCEIVSYESDGLPAEYLGNMLVPAWADHRLERYILQPRGASFGGERKPFIQGGRDFYPSGLAVAPDGSMFVTDWGSKSYELHGKGAIWHIRWKDAKPAKRPADPKQALLSADRRTREAAARELAKDGPGKAFLRQQLKSPDVRVRAAALAALIVVDEKELDLSAIARGDKDVGIREMAVREVVARDVSTSFGGDPALGFAIGGEPGVRAEAIAGARATRDSVFLLKDLLASSDPFLRHAAIKWFAHAPGLLPDHDPKSLVDPKKRVGVLLARQWFGGRQTTILVSQFLNDPDPDVRFLALKWVSDELLETRLGGAIRKQLEEMLKRPDLGPREFIGLSTAIARLDGKPVNEDALAAYFLIRLADKNASAAMRLVALQAIPANHGRLRTEQLIELLKQDDPAFGREVLRVLKDRADAKAAPAVREIVRDAEQPAAVRAQALVTLSAMNRADTDEMIELAAGSDDVLRHEALRALVGAKLPPSQAEKLAAAVKGKPDCDQLLARVLGKPVNAGRPDAKDTEAWLKRLEGGDPQAGRRVFEHPRLSGCYKCHQVEGRGANVGPDLSLVGRTERRWIVESLLQPSAVVAPHYQTWQVQTTDGRTRTGLLVRTYLDESEYIDEKGNRFKVLATDVADVKPLRTSIMPDGLLDGLTDQEIRDLVAYLESRK